MEVCSCDVIATDAGDSMKNVAELNIGVAQIGAKAALAKVRGKVTEADEQTTEARAKSDDKSPHNEHESTTERMPPSTVG